MSLFLYKFFHRRTNERVEVGKPTIPDDMSEWPESWKTVYYKEYKLFKKIPLTLPYGHIWQIAQKRKTTGQNITDNIVSLETLSYILACGYGLQNDPEALGRSEHRTVPSGGQRYPLELYVFLFKGVGECAEGVYHYNVREHALEPVMKKVFSQEEIQAFTPQKAAEGALGMICITSVFHRSTEKYGSRGYRYILLEAGHVAQNIILAATEMKIAFFPVGGISEKTIENQLGLTSVQEGVVYTLFF